MKMVFLFLMVSAAFLTGCASQQPQKDGSLDVENYYERGSAYLYNDDLDRAIADYLAALQIDPNNTVARDNLEIARQQRVLDIEARMNEVFERVQAEEW
jgi:tetratricopeptide (TPR) repeat protein